MVDRLPSTAGQIAYRAGFFTEAIHLRMKPPDRVEDLLGYRRGRLRRGWWLLFMARLPHWNEFEVAGYSYFSGGVVRGHLLAPPDRRPVSRVLRDEGVDIPQTNKSLINNKFTVSGSKRLAKVVPVAGEISGSTQPEYPPGTGVAQLRLVVPVPFWVAAFIRPGDMYRGN